MLLWLSIVAGLLLGFGELFAMWGAGTFEKPLQWPDVVMMFIPLLALESIIISLIFLPLGVAIAIAIVVTSAVAWCVMVLLKVPIKKAVR